LRPERILIPAGADHRVITSGGASSWEDLAMHVVARYCGREEAIRTAKIFVFGDRSEGQLPYMALGKPRRHDDAVIAEAQSWIAEHYATPAPVAQMVARSGLAERTFKRRFRASTGYSPVEYVQALRIEEAKQMLETTDEATDTVAHSVGYEDPTFFRRLFKRRTGTTPGRYRRRYKSVGRPAPDTGRAAS
jgi:transcriptional regulator GlxA family with amidase domain